MVFGESWGVEYDNVVLVVDGVEVAGDIGYDAVVAGVREIELYVAVAEVYSTAGYIDGIDVGGTAAECTEGEAAGVAETVE